jgi:hypothetical protein
MEFDSIIILNNHTGIVILRAEIFARVLIKVEIS